MAASASTDDGRKKKGRGHRSGTGTLLAGRGDVSAAVPASRQKNPAPSVEGWILMVTGVHEDATDDDVRALFFYRWAQKLSLFAPPPSR